MDTLEKLLEGGNGFSRVHSVFHGGLVELPSRAALQNVRDEGNQQAHRVFAVFSLEALEVNAALVVDFHHIASTAFKCSAVRGGDNAPGMVETQFMRRRGKAPVLLIVLRKGAETLPEFIVLGVDALQEGAVLPKPGFSLKLVLFHNGVMIA